MTDLEQWINSLFGTIDAKDSKGLSKYLSVDAVFRFGSADPVTGTGAIIDTLDAFFSSVASLSHRVVDSWEVPGHRICRGEVRYTRLDQRIVTTPFCNVFTMQREQISQYDIYVDPSGLIASQ